MQDQLTPPSKTAHPQPLFVRGDVDGFFGLAIDNLIQFLLILGLCQAVLGFEISLLLSRVLPGAALSIVAGNLFYAFQAQRLSAETGRRDVTALPYGINTVSLFAYVFLVMLPAKLAAQSAGMPPEQAAHAAFRVGLAACFLSGVIELGGATVADWVRRTTPRAALLSTLAGIAISFIAIDFAMRTFEMPLIALLPLGVILTTYFAGVQLPLRIPGGAWAVLLGTALAWGMAHLSLPSPVSAGALSPAFETVGFYPPIPVLSDLIAGLRDPLTARFFVPVIVPMGLFNVLGSLQNLESAEAAGDRYRTAPSLTVNGLGSLLAACFGSCFPTTIYIGHPGWKALGARSGYSILNGAFFCIVALLGLSNAIAALVPIEAGMAIVLWIGIVITAQAFSACKPAHAPAVALGLFPAIAGWGVLILTQALGAAGYASQDPGLADRVLARPDAFLEGAGLHLRGLVALSQGFMLSCLVWAGASAHLIDRNFSSAARFMLVGAVLAFFGFIHAGEITAAGAVYHIGWASGLPWAIGYLLCATFFALTGAWVKKAGAKALGHGH